MLLSIKKLLLILLIYSCFSNFLKVESRVSHDFKIHNKVPTNMEQSLENMGLSIEKYTTTTKDNYTLSIFRINRKINTNYCKNSITLMHGLASNSDSFIRGGNESMVYRLAVEKGYELWLPNLRGTTYSLTHKNLKPKHKQFWQFSFEEMGLYDLPAICEVILEKQNNKKTTMLAMSLSAQALSVFEATDPEKHFDCVNHQIFLTPNVYYRHLNPDLRVLSYFKEPLQPILNGLYKGRIRPASSKNKFKNVLYLLGLNSIEQTRAKEPVSVKYFAHILQFVKSGLFRRFDYGESENLEKYGSEKSPIFDLSKNRVCTDVYAGKDDEIIDVDDVKYFHSALPAAAKCRLNVIDGGKNVSNLDFLPISENIQDLFYQTLLNNLKYDNICTL